MDDYIRLVKCRYSLLERYMNNKSIEYLFCFRRQRRVQFGQVDFSDFDVTFKYFVFLQYSEHHLHSRNQERVPQVTLELASLYNYEEN